MRISEMEGRQIVNNLLYFHQQNGFELYTLKSAADDLTRYDIIEKITSLNLTA